MMGASRRHSSRETAQVVGMRKEAVAKAGAVAGKTGEAEGRVTRVEEVRGVIEIPVEVGEGEDVADKVDEMDRAIGTRAEAAVRDEAATILEADSFSASMAHGSISPFQAHTRIIIARLN